MFDELEARTADGVTLRIDRVRARGERRGVVVCLHAMMTDGRYFGARREGSFAAALADAGLDVFVPDFRGHGRSVPPRAGEGDWTFDDLVELDLPAIVAAVAEAAETAPGELALLGHSLGGLVASAALGTGRIPAPRVLGLAATSVWMSEHLHDRPHGVGLLATGAWLREAAMRRAIMGTYRHVTKVLGRAPIRALRVGTADEAAGYVDQLTGWVRDGRWTSRTGVDYLAALAHVGTRAFAFSGAGDWMCRPRDAAAIARRIATCAPLRVVGRTYGDALDPDHFELFTRPELASLRAEVARQLIA